jgi:hypothetical protein
MDSNAAWDSTRWRESSYATSTRGPSHRTTTPGVSHGEQAGSSGRSTESQNSCSTPWSVNTQTSGDTLKHEQLPSPANSRLYMQELQYPSQSYERQPTPAQCGSRARFTPPGQHGGWYGSGSDDRRHLSHTHAVQEHSSYSEDVQNKFAQRAELSVAATPSSLAPSRKQSTTLPSFAELQGLTRHNDDSDDEPKIAPMSERITCDLCAKLKPMVETIAGAMVDLDDDVQTYCNGRPTRVR